ncbi:protein of unknown function [Taphrina deformans PYCC 5710]|uniref:Anaphase-promoting complex subunit 4-like WD40 domain-containing protein n=1 Tax=Taphrina deformans (strain PYCC 5710 / ATCC 11124 / CBS 356.35 / IMI 108563 / JCM 9778 / NBRC 8474) TaxID=1097556 RepID=R4XGM2_TAPDE|nr:protein of unknown function [Taphrina deformans PYCC 5710]|eukprot:CCG84807.1 protein of unknown function [Taphrina deformans PYCC 5710]
MALNYLVYNERSSHTSDIFSIACTNDSIISTSADGTVRYWDAATSELTSTVDNAFKMSGHSLVAAEDTVIGAGFSGELKEFEPSSTAPGKDIAMTSDKDPVNWVVTLSPDAATIATTTSNGSLNVYDRASKTLVANIETRGKFGLCVDYAPNNRFIASGHVDGGLYLFDTELGKLKHAISQTKTIRTVQFSPRSDLLAAAGASCGIAIFDVKTAEQVALLQGHSHEITTLAWNGSGELLLTGSVDGKVKLWHLGRKECVGTFTEGNGHKIWCVRWCKIGPQKAEGFVVGGSEKVLRFYLPQAA